jgi:hypothetical protein
MFIVVVLVLDYTSELDAEELMFGWGNLPISTPRRRVFVASAPGAAGGS